MKTIYILTEGDYSDYHIIGVYSTKELAEKAQFLYQYSQIEEYSLDNVPDYPPGMTGWFVSISNKDSQIAYTMPATPSEAKIPSEGEYNYEFKNDSGYFVYCWAVDKDHAQKIALDKYYQHQAQKANLV